MQNTCKFTCRKHVCSILENIHLLRHSYNNLSRKEVNVREHIFRNLGHTRTPSFYYFIKSAMIAIYNKNIGNIIYFWDKLL